MKGKVVGFLFLLLLSVRVWAVDGVSLEFGKGFYTDELRVGVIWDSQLHWSLTKATQVGVYLEATAGVWRGHSQAGENQTVTDVGFTPVFRLQATNLSEKWVPYFESAIGLHLISPAFIYSNRKFGSSFQFGDLAGVGIRFGEQLRCDLGYRFIHVSNGNITQPNHGINFSQVRFSYHF